MPHPPGSAPDQDATTCRAAAAGCRGCELHRDASRIVFGRGDASARVLATIHPSAVLRADNQDIAYDGLVADLTVAARALTR
ncbi:uracil-DNA glycosylase [Micromonospora craniellae]|uniref:Uracil-DNA glycosylase n=1 Tax=Micromonospora craniellae TaxID=2294034 RepID=A0A372G4U9_9ACTN|nr:uracil-DNA glycosylase [Micromonospora craniellae]RFS47924.1 uracil-DNA glycosylase [Micromonospora craniellae]